MGLFLKKGKSSQWRVSG